jgi:hypothetical protein
MGQVLYPFERPTNVEEIERHTVFAKLPPR